MRSIILSALMAAAAAAAAESSSSCATWYEGVTHGPNYRNVKDFGAKGDGVTDDSAAIIAALTNGRTPAYTTHSNFVVYLPPGTYLVSQTLPLWFYTSLVGNFLCPPTILLAPNTFPSGQKFVISADVSYSGEHDDDFYRGVQHVRIVISSGNAGATGLFWAVSQATYIRDVVIDMTAEPGATGLFIENGSGGFISDIVVLGGKVGLSVGNQQWTWRNVTVSGSAVSCVNIFWTWVFTFAGLTLSDCPVGLQFTSSADGALLLLDTSATNVGTLVSSTKGDNIRLYFERLTATNVPNITANLPGNAAGTVNVPSWYSGPAYSAGQLLGPAFGPLPLTRPDTPLPQRPRPNFGSADGSSGVASVYTYGAKGDGSHDDTAAIQAAVTANAQVFFPQGSYLVSGTITLRPDSALVGEIFSILLAQAGSAAWSDASNPNPLLLAPAGSAVQLADLLFSQTGDAPGLIYLDWQSGPAGGTWDVQWRINATAHTLLHVHGPGSGGYFEESWGWVADHDIDTGANLTVVNPHGMLFENEMPTYLYGVAAEHSALYQFNFSGAQNVTVVVAQTESPYWQVPVSALAMTVEGGTSGMQIYGTGFYNWFNGNQTTVFTVDTASVTNMNAFGVNVHGVNNVVVTTSQGTIQAYTPVEEEWFCDGFAAYTGL